MSEPIIKSRQQPMEELRGEVRDGDHLIYSGRVYLASFELLAAVSWCGHPAMGENAGALPELAHRLSRRSFQ